MKGSQANYEKKNLVQIKLALNRNTDQDLIEWIQSPAVPNVRKMIIRLLREEMQKNGK